MDADEKINDHAEAEEHDAGEHEEEREEEPPVPIEREIQEHLAVERPHTCRERERERAHAQVAEEVERAL